MSDIDDKKAEVIIKLAKGDAEEILELARFTAQELKNRAEYAKSNQEFTNDEIMRNVQRVEIKIDKGFSDIKERQDKTNGNVLVAKTWIEKNDEFVQDLKKERSDNRKRTIDITWKVGSAIMLSGVGIKLIIEVLSKM